MKRKTLTDLAVIHAKPKDVAVRDQRRRPARSAAVGSTSGAKSWVLRYRHPISGVSRKMTLPAGLSLAAARKIASDAMFQVAQGIDPVEAKKVEVEAKASAAEGTVQAVCARYMELQGNKLRSHAPRLSTLKRHIYPRLGSKQVTDLKRTDIVAALDIVEKTDGPMAADMALGDPACHPALARATGQDTFKSPLIAGMKSREGVRACSHPRSQRRRDQAVLERVRRSSHRLVWEGRPVRDPDRREEERGVWAPTSEIDAVRDNGDQYRVWTLPVARSKNKRPSFARSPRPPKRSLTTSPSSDRATLPPRMCLR